MEKYDRVESVASRLRKAMGNAHKTQADLVRETGISKGTLSRYLSGKFEPKQIAVNKLAVSLNVSEMWLWGYDVPMENKKTAPEIGSGQSEAKKKLFALAEDCTEEEAERLLQMMELFLNRK
jgi:transcriptional regulator with XRE-family HTH domain